MGRHASSKIGFAILKAISDGADIFEYSTRRPSAALRYGVENLKILDAERARLKVQQSICRLKRQRLLEEIQLERRRAFRLTAFGEMQLRRAQKILPSLLPQGMLTIVCFDIPEKQKHARQSFRRFLRAAQFRRLQLSVWVSDRDWAMLLDEHLRQHDLKPWVQVFHAREPDRSLAAPAVFQ